MVSNNRHSAIESTSAFTAKVEDLVKEIVIQNNILYYRIESSVEHLAGTQGEDTFMPVIRVITYFEDTVAQIARLLNTEFEVVAETSVDKKKSNVESFSYKHIQYLVGLKANRRELTEYKRSGDKKFEIQICSMLQDAWAGIEKELGYDSATFPEEAKRDLYRVGALLEMADLEFLKIRSKFMNAPDVQPEPRVSEPAPVASPAPMPQPAAVAEPAPAPKPQVYEIVVNETPAPQPQREEAPAPVIPQQPVYEAPQPVQPVYQAPPPPPPVQPVFQVPQPVYQAPPPPVQPVYQAPEMPAAPQPEPQAYIPQEAPKPTIVDIAPEIAAAPIYTNGTHKQEEPKYEAPKYEVPVAPIPAPPVQEVIAPIVQAMPEPAPAPRQEPVAPAQPIPAPVAQAPVVNNTTAQPAASDESMPFFEDVLDEQSKAVSKPSPLDENAPITDSSLKEYVQKSKLLKEIDKQIADRAGARINNDIDIEGDVERLRFLKVYTLKQLHDRLKDNKDDIVAFAEKWIGKDNGGSFDSGISLFYLEYLLVGKRNDPAFAVEYVVKFISDNDYSARYIIPTYNSIRNTEAPNFSHLTLK